MGQGLEAVHHGLQDKLWGLQCSKQQGQSIEGGEAGVQTVVSVVQWLNNQKPTLTWPLDLQIEACAFETHEEAQTSSAARTEGTG